MYVTTTRYAPVAREVQPAASRKAVSNEEIVTSLGFVAIQLLALAICFLLLTGPAARGPLP